MESLLQDDQKPAPICSDEVFVRRVYLDVAGRIPTVKEVVNFIEDKNKSKRKLLIDQLLESNN